MSRKKGSVPVRGFTVQVHGIRYSEFAKIKWQQFLRIYTVVLVLILIALGASMAMGHMPERFPISGALAILLILLAILAVFRSSIKGEYRKSGLGSVELFYSFDRDGWTVKNSQGQVTVPWSQTWRVKRNDRALLLYPNRKSVNLVPARCLSKEQMDQVIAWCTGKKTGKT